jgi:PAS domain S-box-containing protein
MDTTTFFDDYCRKAKLNCILIMDDKGIILGTNQAFLDNFGYNKEDLNGHHFRKLFSLSDRDKNKPEIELATILSDGHALDENYVLNKDGKEIWVTGEAMLIQTKAGKPYIVKDVVNLQSKNQLEYFHIETEELMEKIFEGNRDTAMVVLDGMGKIIKLNQPFVTMFDIAEIPAPGSKLSQLNHSFWHTPFLRSEIREILVKGTSIKKSFTLQTASGEALQLKFTVKVLGRDERKIYVIIEKELANLHVEK